MGPKERKDPGLGCGGILDSGPANVAGPLAQKDPSSPLEATTLPLGEWHMLSPCSALRGPCRWAIGGQGARRGQDQAGRAWGSCCCPTKHPMAQATTMHSTLVAGPNRNLLFPWGWRWRSKEIGGGGGVLWEQCSGV